MDNNAMLLTEWAQGLITAGCISLALAVMFWVVRDGIRKRRRPCCADCGAEAAGCYCYEERPRQDTPKSQHIDSDRYRGGRSDWDRECQESGRLNRGQ